MTVPPRMGKTGFEYRFDVSSQVIAAGAQNVHVQVIVPLSGPGRGQIGIRVGRLIVSVSDREALDSFLQARGKAAGWAEKAFGAELPLPRVGESVSVEQSVGRGSGRLAGAPHPTLTSGIHDPRPRPSSALANVATFNN